MTTLLLVLGIGFAGLAVGVLVKAAGRPDTFQVTRSATIAAPAEKIFPLIDDLHQFNRWNPFLKKDPDARLVYSGPASGRGAAHAWEGNRNVGKGDVEIIESSPPAKVVMNLHMIRPMQGDNRVEFTLQPGAGATTVTWSMQGRQPLLAKVMTVFIDCDKMVGGDFQKGLAELKAIAEG